MPHIESRSLSKILSNINVTMEKSTFALWAMRESINKSKGKDKRLEMEQLERMRRRLYPYWHEIVDFVGSNCYQVAMDAADLRNARNVSEVVGVLQDLQRTCEECQGRAKSLIKEHETFMRDFDNQSASEFQSRCRELGGQLHDLDALIDEELNRCRKFDSSMAKAVGNANEIGKSWYKEARKVQETAAGIQKHLDNISMTMSGNSQSGPNPRPPRCLIV